MIDVSGAIYVIGGYNGTTYFNDVWVSTDGGALPDSAGGRGYWGHSRCLRGAWVYLEGLWGTRSTRGVV